MPTMLGVPTERPEPAACGRCERTLRGSTYELRGPDGVARRCLRCGLRYRPLVIRSLVISVVVGTLITAINQGNTLIGGGAAAEPESVRGRERRPLLVRESGEQVNAGRRKSCSQYIGHVTYRFRKLHDQTSNR